MDQRLTLAPFRGPRVVSTTSWLKAHPLDREPAACGDGMVSGQVPGHLHGTSQAGLAARREVDDVIVPSNRMEHGPDLPRDLEHPVPCLVPKELEVDHPSRPVDEGDALACGGRQHRRAKRRCLDDDFPRGLRRECSRGPPQAQLPDEEGAAQQDRHRPHGCSVPRTGRRSSVSPPRRTVTRTGLPTRRRPSASWSWCTSLTASPSAPVITSPGWVPATSAGPPVSAFTTMAPRF